MEAKGESVYFDAFANHYDRLGPLRNEGYRFCQQLVLDFIPYDAGTRFRMLDVGCGTGSFIERIVETYPNAVCQGFDYSEKMLRCAATKLRNYADRVTFHRRDLNDGLPGDIGPLQIVASFWAVHHLTDENKARLFRQVRNALSPDGWFFLVDSVSAGFEKGVFEMGSRRHSLRLEERLRNAGEDMRETEHLGAIKSRLAEDSPEKDRFASIATQLKWLEEAGFGSVDHIWHLWRRHFIIARP